MKVLVIGGAGYIGSHCLRQLEDAGHEPVVLDNLVFGHRAAIPESRFSFYEGDLGDAAFLERIFETEKIDIVMHFAAYAYVGESVTDPLKYYDNNVARPVILLRTMQKVRHHEVRILLDLRHLRYPRQTADHRRPPATPDQPLRADQAGCRNHAQGMRARLWA